MDRYAAFLGVAAGLMLVAGEAPATEASDAARVQLEALDGGAWRATYSHPDGVGALRFSRAAEFLREQAWRIDTDGYVLARDGDSQVVRLEGGRTPGPELVFHVTLETRFIPRDYELFNSFTDGAVAVFLGAYLADSLSGTTTFNRVEITPPDGHHVVINGKLSGGTTQWVDSAGHGTYAYVGTEVPVIGAASAAIIDPGLPGWIASSAQHRIDRIIEAFTARMGRSSDQMPFVLLSHESRPAAGYAFNGGTRDDLVQLRLQGDDWQMRSPEAERRLMRFIAHEVAHLWNGQSARPAPDAPPWMHEGSADALADLVLAELDEIRADDVRRGLERALNRCHGPLRDNDPLGVIRTPQVHYACGHVLSYWTHLEMLSAGHEAGLFAFWEALIQAHGQAPGGYGEADYFAVLGRMGVDGEAVASMRRFVSTSLASPARSIADAWAPHGVAVEQRDALAPLSSSSPLQLRWCRPS